MLRDNPTDELEYRKNHPFCAFCQFSCHKFMRTVCMKDPMKHKPCAKGCPYYTPTLQPIEHRSLN